MTIRTVILLGAAALALSSSGAIAQNTDYNRYGGGPPVSTPDERAQTQGLNAEGMNGTTSSPAQLNGAAPAQDPYDATTVEGYQQNPPYSRDARYGGPPPEENAPVGDEAGPPSGPQAQYEDQQQQYQQQLQRYGNQQQRYQYDRQRYVQDARAYDLAQYAWSYPAPVEYRYDEGGLQPLYLIAEPSQQLWQVPVSGPGGRWVGRVRNVETAPDGRPLRIEIALNRRVSVWVRPGDLRFDPDDRVLYTDLTRDQLWDMPGATIESSPL
ncbi:MAG TPA: hypothetical protein VHY79_06975 [Rhizomicrobium sp.]|jgi:hypothetical protein|nr:hypothetical protein [Rhizomicrobium sp.]